MNASSKNIVYLDIETQKSSFEVGGWHKKHLMRLSIGVIYSSFYNKYFIFSEQEVDQLLRMLRQSDCIVGYNIVGFDIPVLESYSVFNLSDIPCLDLLIDIEKKISRRIKLDQLAKATLGIGKTGHGLQALQWWKEGKLLDIAEYCCYDVKITKLIHEYGMQHGKVYYDNAEGIKEQIPVNWVIS
ncbi:ribonuclease H-like domain-containing protein [Methylacidiphilum caldifontis]|uniref:Helicase n=1 Tax=Methylacidiphilum caldifontis TaxID=2795386 RepID=A0A4Y8PHG7_9BACT|nr:ribonuclease H-like domain-containing protein [Methylacidiphilum caldifontis]QSR88292.1 ribonuclease H-like domain-containing protein [Methylacidiphilum caldifontis]TFE70604.1 helicase [Methylacidiphilum caldifontis]